MKQFNYKTGLLLVILLYPVISIFGQNSKKEAETAIEKVLAMQSNAWNKADLEKFMEGYWNSDSLKFIGKNGITKGWSATLANYKKSYPDKATMGELKFEILSKEPLGDGHYLVIGKWRLQREKDAPEGHFSLVWKNINGKWVIIADHSS